MRHRSVILRSAISGVAWAGIAILLLLIVEGNVHYAGRLAWQMRGGVLAAPLIGVALGLCSWRYFRDAGWRGRVFISLLTLYAAAFLFNLTAELTSFVSGEMRPASLSTVIFNSGAVSFVGLTDTGFVLVLGPLAFINHRWVSRAAQLA